MKIIESNPFNKHKTAKIIIFVLCILVLFSSNIVFQLYAKYINKDVRNDSSHVASFEITHTNMYYSDNFVVDIVPGEVNYQIQIENKSEVAVESELKLINVTNNLPLEFSIDGNTRKTGENSKVYTIQSGNKVICNVCINWPIENANIDMGKVDLIKCELAATQLD